MGLEAVREDLHRRQVVGVVGVEHRPIVDRQRQVGRRPAARGQLQRNGGQPPLIVEADVVGGLEVMPLAGHDHVLVAIRTALGRAAGLHRDQGGGGGEQRGLRLLAAEAFAHAADLHGDGGVWAIQHARDQVLDLAGMLGRRPDVDVAVLARRGQGHLALEVEVVLAADRELALDPARRGGERGLGVAARHALRGLDLQVHGPSGGDVDGGRQILVLDDGQAGGGACGGDRDGGDGEQALAHAIDLASRRLTGSEQLVVVDHRADVVLAGDVLGGQHQHHAGRGADGREIQLGDLRMRAGAHAQVHVQQTGRLGNVVDIDRRARYVARGAVMRQGGVDALERGGLDDGGGGVSHARSPERCGSPHPSPGSPGTPCAAYSARSATGRPPRRACRSSA